MEAFFKGTRTGYRLPHPLSHNVALRNDVDISIASFELLKVTGQKPMNGAE
jgi:hypothetical protein